MIQRIDFLLAALFMKFQRYGYGTAIRQKVVLAATRAVSWEFIFTWVASGLRALFDSASFEVTVV